MQGVYKKKMKSRGEFFAYFGFIRKKIEKTSIFFAFTLYRTEKKCYDRKCEKNTQEVRYKNGKTFKKKDFHGW